MQDSLEVCPVPGKGRGVVARRRFAKDEIIEQAPVLVLPGHEYELLEQTALKDYYFDWGGEHCAIPLGLSMLFNYSGEPNAQVLREIAQERITFVALRAIDAGEEITFQYACGPWFEVCE